MSDPLAAWLLLVVSSALLGCAATPVEAPAEAFRGEDRMRSEVDGQRLRYLIEVPATESRPQDGWPLLLFLHGAGERGDDLARVRVHGPLKHSGELAALEQCILVAPQCPDGDWWRASTLRALVDEVRAQYAVDDSRLYLTGLSMGGYGTWSLLSRNPDLFAAALAICGGGDTTRLWPGQGTDFELAGLLQARDVPIWAVHGEEDRVVPIEESKLLVDALREAGAEVRWTPRPGVAHDSWTDIYADPLAYEWIFAQRRAAR